VSRFVEQLEAEHGNNGHALQCAPAAPATVANAIRAEEGIIAAISIRRDYLATVREFISCNDFSRDHTRKIFIAAEELIDAGGEADAVTLAETLEARGWLEDVGGEAYLVEILTRESHAANVEHYCRMVADRARRLELSLLAGEILNSVRDYSQSVEEIVGRIDLGRFTRGASDRFKLYSSAEFDSEQFATEWLIDNILVKGQPCLLAGPKKSLKTSIVVLLAILLAIGSRLFGRFKTKKPVRVLIFSGESGGATLQETARRQARSLGWSLSSIENLYWCLDLPQMGSPEDMGALRERIARYKADVVILDCAYLMLGDVDHSNLFEMGPRLRELTRICEETGCTPLLLHHTKKSIQNPYEPAELEGIAFAGFQEWARQWLLINRRCPYDPEKPGEHQLWFSWGGSAGHGGLLALNVAEGAAGDVGGRYWECEAIPAAQARAEAGNTAEERKEEARDSKLARTLERYKKRVLAYLADHPEGDTRSNISVNSKLPGDKGSLVISDLIEAGVLEACKVLKGKRTFDAVRLATQTVGQSESESDCPNQEAVRQNDSPLYIRGNLSECLTDPEIPLDDYF
jgi:hypothetical protein